MTFSIMKLNIMKLNIIKLNIIKLSIMTHSVMTCNDDVFFLLFRRNALAYLPGDGEDAGENDDS
jgi:hypothetical protein